MKPNILDYTIATATTAEEFAAKCKALTDKGYQPMRQEFTVTTVNTTNGAGRIHTYFQGFVLTDDKTFADVREELTKKQDEYMAVVTQTLSPDALLEHQRQAGMRLAKMNVPLPHGASEAAIAGWNAIMNPDASTTATPASPESAPAGGSPGDSVPPQGSSGEGAPAHPHPMDAAPESQPAAATEGVPGAGAAN